MWEQYNNVSWRNSDGSPCICWCCWFHRNPSLRYSHTLIPGGKEAVTEQLWLHTHTQWHGSIAYGMKIWRKLVVAPAIMVNYICSVWENTCCAVAVHVDAFSHECIYFSEWCCFPFRTSPTIKTLAKTYACRLLRMLVVIPSKGIE